MIYDGIPAEELDQYLRARAWFTSRPAARLSQDDLAANSSVQDKQQRHRRHTTARSALPHGTPRGQRILKHPYPKGWT